MKLELNFHRYRQIRNSVFSTGYYYPNKLIHIFSFSNCRLKSKRNGTNLGEFKIESGANGLDQLGFIRTWNGNESVDYWNDTYCNMINGIQLIRLHRPCQ